MMTAVDGRRRIFLIFCCIALVSALVIKSSTDVAARSQEPVSRAGSGQRVADCGGEPCDAVIRGGLAFLDRRLRGVEGNGRSCADCHMPTDHFQLSPASVEASGSGS